ncbi:hypothetical protein C8A01DRAFT_35011 [Parachaetomium inaequale]|uniref:Uncharacterized protein n=1 Tax=Parachaetomium inaequale TaxID=2588326 RepID=A0AAN6SSS3_9PEZI|nr:hypothetical protein C8A01DRAFT_35011 [Parachaetomium inaequale]
MSTSASDQPPKRVILRLRCNEFEDRVESYNEAIAAYLSSVGRKFSEYQERRYVAHIQGHQDYQEGNPRASFHITLGIEAAMIRDPDWDKLPHEIYRIRRRKDDGTPVVTPLPARYLDIARSFTDRSYAWGEHRRMKEPLEARP